MLAPGPRKSGRTWHWLPKEKLMKTVADLWNELSRHPMNTPIFLYVSEIPGDHYAELVVDGSVVMKSGEK